MTKIYTDIFFMIGAFLNAALFVPQALLLYKTKKVEGVSLPMFLGFNMIQFVTALHGYMSKDYILMWGYTLSFITCGVVTVLILYYSTLRKSEIFRGNVLKIWCIKKISKK